MTIKTALAALALTLVPMMGFAMGGCSDHNEQAQSCAAGHTWDTATNSCVKQVTS